MSNPENSRRVDGNIVFLAHWVETNNWLFWFFPSLRRDPTLLTKWYIWLALPLCRLMSVFYLFGKRSHDVVDRYKIFGRNGEIILIRNFGWHYMIKWIRWYTWPLMCRNILDAVLAAQENGASVIGLGALTKDANLTDGGKAIVYALGNQLRVPIVHGDTLTAATVLNQILRLRHELCMTERHGVFITGGTSKIGRVLARALAERRIMVYLHSDSEKRVQEIQREAGSDGFRIQRVTHFRLHEAAMIWVTGKSDSGAGLRLIEALPQGAHVINFAVPDPLTPRLLAKRPDLHHVDGGLLAYDTGRIRLSFTMRLRPGLTYACHAGTMVHGLEGWIHHEIGPVDYRQLDRVWSAAVSHGFWLPAWTSHLRPVRR